jgi:murein DD-endopeptidase MepM/ murein hydrolase activator NlpD
VSARRHRARRAIGLGVLTPWLLLIPGLLLTHPAKSGAEGKPAKPAQRGAEPKALERGVRAGRGAVQGCVHVVRQGDSVSRVALRHGVTRQSIIAANHLANPDALRLGQRLEMPACHPDRAPRGGAGQTAVLGPEGTVLRLVGPRRVLTRLHLAEPAFSSEALEFLWPVEGPVVSGFGRRRAGWHAGVDIKADLGTPVLAAAPGTVYFAGTERAYGKVIKIQHVDGFTSIYAHNLQNLVEVGDDVEAGVVIATVGRSGRANGYHLHFEIRRDGMAYNPEHVVGPREPAATVVAGDIAAPPGSAAAALRPDDAGYE